MSSRPPEIDTAEMERIQSENSIRFKLIAVLNAYRFDANQLFTNLLSLSKRKELWAYLEGVTQAADDNTADEIAKVDALHNAVLMLEFHRSEIIQVLFAGNTQVAELLENPLLKEATELHILDRILEALVPEDLLAQMWQEN